MKMNNLKVEILKLKISKGGLKSAIENAISLLEKSENGQKT